MNRHTLLLAVVLLYAAAFRFIALNRPFEYDLEAASNCQYGVLARNYLRFDLGQTQGIPVLTVSHLPNAPIRERKPSDRNLRASTSRQPVVRHTIDTDDSFPHAEACHSQLVPASTS